MHRLELAFNPIMSNSLGCETEEKIRKNEDNHRRARTKGTKPIALETDTDSGEFNGMIS